MMGSPVRKNCSCLFQLSSSKLQMSFLNERFMLLVPVAMYLTIAGLSGLGLLRDGRLNGYYDRFVFEVCSLDSGAQLFI